MDRRVRQWGAVFCLVAMAFFAGWPFWKWVYLRPVRASLRDRAQALAGSENHR